MSIKVTALAFVAVSAPLFLSASSPAPVQDPEPAAASPRADVEELRREVRELRQRLREAVQRADDAERAAGRTRKQLEESLDLLEKSTQPVARRSCTPSRSRTLLTHYQWFDENGHEQRAHRAIAGVIERHGKRNNQLNSLAWDLMTDKETVGKFDRAALAIADRMEKNGKLRHNELDTVALAKFLNGDVDQAIALQTRAIEKGGNSDDYRRRLRTYQAAKEQRDGGRVSPAVAVAAGGDH